MSAPSVKVHKTSAGRGWRWRAPDETVREGDEILGWVQEHNGPCFIPRLPYKFEGKRVREINFFVRTRQAQPNPNKSHPDKEKEGDPNEPDPLQS